MPAPKGNQYAVGNKGGRQRTVTPNDEELEKLGQEMVEWVVQNKPLHLNQWYSVEKHILWDQFKRYAEKEVFRPYYEHAQALISQHYLTKDSKIEPNMKNRFARHYFKEVKEDENELLKYKAELQKLTGESDQQKIIEALKEMNQNLKASYQTEDSIQQETDQEHS